MATWNEFETQAPEIAAAARRLLGLDGTALGYIGTGSATESPQDQAVSPILCAENLYLILPEDLPTAADLMRGAGFTLHAPLGADGEEVVVSGIAHLIVYGYEREAAQRASGETVDPEDLVFRLAIGSAVRTTGASGPVSWAE